jgi:hypothetical protein
MKNIYHNSLNEFPNSNEDHKELHNSLKDESFKSHINSTASQSHNNVEKILSTILSKGFKEPQSNCSTKPYTIDQIEHIYKSFRNN